jgi:PAP2 superfamily
MAARREASRADVRPVTATAQAGRARLAWPRLPAAAELATIGAGYVAYSLVRLVIHAGRQAAFAHAAQLWSVERRMHLTIEPNLNHLAAAHSVLAEAAGYYYGLLHFLVTPLVVAWLYLRRPAAFPPLRSALVLATAAANVVFWVWPAAPPRFSVPGMTDILVTHDILGAADPRGATSLVNLYAAMPSLHVAWAAWCAVAVVTAARGRWRHLAWLYPLTTTLVVLASANHFLLDVAGGLAVVGLGMLATRSPSPLLVHCPARQPRAPAHLGPGPRPLHRTARQCPPRPGADGLRRGVVGAGRWVRVVGCRRHDAGAFAACAPSGRNGAVENIRALMAAKRSAHSERTQMINRPGPGPDRNRRRSPSVRSTVAK